MITFIFMCTKQIYDFFNVNYNSSNTVIQEIKLFGLEHPLYETEVVWDSS